MPPVSGPSRVIAVLRKIAKRGKKEVAESLEDIETFLKVLQAAAEAANIPVVKGALGVVLELVTLARKVKDGRERCVRLAREAGNLLLSVNNFVSCDPCMSKTINQPETSLAEFVSEFCTLVQQVHEDMLNCTSNLKFFNQARFNARIAQSEIDVTRAHTKFNTMLLMYTTSRVASQNTDLVRFDDGGDADGYGIRWPQVKVGRATAAALSAPARSWWANTYTAKALGESVIIKQYGERDRSKFDHDKADLRRIRDPGVPQLFGYSVGQTAPFFIAIKTSFVIPLTEYLPMLCTKHPDTALWDIYNKILDYLTAARELYERTRCIPDSETFVADENGNFLVAPGCDRFWSQRPAVLYFQEIALKSDLRPVRTLNRPSSFQLLTSGRVPSAVRLRSILQTGYGTYTWPADLGYEAATVGDVGHIVTRNGRRLFRRLCNVLCQGVKLNVKYRFLDETGAVWGPQPRMAKNTCCWDTKCTRTVDVTCTLLKTTDADIHSFLRENAGGMGRQHGVRPEDLMLVTQTRGFLHLDDIQYRWQRFHFVDFDDFGFPGRVYVRHYWDERKTEWSRLEYDCGIMVTPAMYWHWQYEQLECEQISEEGDD